MPGSYVTESYTIFRERYKPSDPRLGRHVLHDSRSLNFQVEPESVDTLQSVRHQRYIPILDQGQLGSCTGNAAVGCLGTGLFWDTIKGKNVIDLNSMKADEDYAIQVYSEATHLDPYSGAYPPTDTGSDGLSVAKVLKAHGLISGYLHATSLAAALTALSKQPLITGTKWLNGMFTPMVDGKLNISGSLAGGHEYVLDELDVENRRVWMANSWNLNWGRQGRAYLSWDDFGQLLADNGDVTAFVPLTAPAPTPTPPAPPAPTPTDDKAALKAAYNEFNNAVTRFQAAIIRYTG